METQTIDNTITTAAIPRLQTLVEEVGIRGVALRGRKVREAAIHFEKHFRDRQFTAEEFDEWKKTEPTLADYPNGTTARHALGQAGKRGDMPRTFQIVRTDSQRWTLVSIEELILSEHLPDQMRKCFSKWYTEVTHWLQAGDWASLDPARQHMAWVSVMHYKNLQNMVLVGLDGMADIRESLKSPTEEFRPPDTNGEETVPELPQPAA
jgi:hypothetical protein